MEQPAIKPSRFSTSIICMNNFAMSSNVVQGLIVINWCSAAGDRFVGPRSPDGAAVEGVHVEARLPQPGRLQ